MIFETLYESAEKNELFLVQGGYCRFHCKKDGSITIYELLVLPFYRNKGVGTKLLDHLLGLEPSFITAKCPQDLPANDWYRIKGFKTEESEVTKSGRVINVWRLRLN